MIKILSLARTKNALHLLPTTRRTILEKTERRVRPIVSSVRKDGNKALQKFVLKFDHAKLLPSQFKVSKREIDEAYKAVSMDFLTAIQTAARNIEGYQKTTLPKFKKSQSGAFLKIRPLHRVGIYIPGGLASYPSTALMTVIPARVAGVKEIVAATPPRPDGKMAAETLVALDMAGATEIYKMGGAHAIAALAYGTETIKKVDKIVGPGNVYVQFAKKLVFGDVDIDFFAGPSELVILADGSVPAEFAAWDLLAQAEHGPDSLAVLITTSGKYAEEVSKAVTQQLKTLPRKNILQKSIARLGRAFIVKDLQNGVDLVNTIAPEHLEIHTKSPEFILTKIQNAGAIFLGPYSPTALGDYAAGPSHVLPTGGQARFFSPLDASEFIKKSSVVSYSRNQLKALSNTIQTIASAEGFSAHANSIRSRFKSAHKRWKPSDL